MAGALFYQLQKPFGYDDEWYAYNQLVLPPSLAIFQPLPIDPIAVFSVCERVSIGVVKYLLESASTRNDSSASAGVAAPSMYHRVSVNSASDSPMSDTGPSYSCCVTVTPATFDSAEVETSDNVFAPGNNLISAATVA